MADVRVTVPNESNYVINTSTNTPIAVTGLASLVQIIVKTLLTTPGQDVFEPAYGGGLASILGPTASPGKVSSATADVGFSVMKTMQDIIDEQNKSIDTLTASARLRALHLNKFEYDVDQGLWVVDILVESEAGASANVELLV
jgi:hypothetical protein